jgi:hypothetical protein
MAQVCVTCGAQYPKPEQGCKICEDERQYVASGGQKWAERTDLLVDHKNIIKEEEPGITGIGTEPSFAIGQRALLIQTGVISRSRPSHKVAAFLSSLPTYAYMIISYRCILTEVDRAIGMTICFLCP